MLLGLAGLAGCRTDSSPSSRDADMPRYHNWWNFYERSLSRIEREDYLGGSEDLERALGLRGGARPGLVPDDMWRARTYGLHFVEGFFPRRELGICYYKLGRLPEAAMQLEQSLRQQPSGRARHYLNRVRLAQLGGTRVAPPSIRVDAPGESLYTTARVARIEWHVEAAGYVRNVSVNGRPEFLELAVPSRVFTRRAPLAEGSNVWVVTAADLLGQSARREIRLIADWRPPSLVVRGAVREGLEWRFTVVCLDDQGLASVLVNGVENLVNPKDAEAPRDLPLEIRLRDRRPAAVELRDRAGNAFHAVLTVPAGTAGTGFPSPPVFAEAPQAADTDGGPVTMPQAPEAPAADGLPPILEVKGGGRTLATSRDQCYLEGSASDWHGRGLDAVTVNGTSILRGRERGGCEARFGLRLALAPGTNVFRVAAVDGAGNRTERQVTVIRKPPRYLDDELRLRIAVVPPVVGGDDALREQVLGHMTARLLQSGEGVPARFHLVERDGTAWDAILREYELSRPDVADAKAALRCGRLLPAEMLLVTSILKDANGLTLRGRILETETGKAVWTDDVYGETVAEFCGEQIPGFVLKLEQAFPLVGAHVTGVRGAEAVIDAGAEEGLRSGTRFLIVQRTAEGAEEAMEDVLEGVQLRLERVAARRGTGVVLPAAAASRVRTGDYVYAR